MGRDRKRGKSNKAWKSPGQGSQSSSQKKRRQRASWNDDLELEFQFFNNGRKPARENKSQRRHSLPASLNDKPPTFRKFQGSPVASLRNPTPRSHNRTAPRPHNTYAYDYSKYQVDENVHTLQTDEVEDLTRAYVKMAVNTEDTSSSSESSEVLDDDSDSSAVEENSDGEHDYNDLLAYEDSSGEGGNSSEFDDLDSDDDEHESEDDEGEDMDTDEEEIEEEAMENEDQDQEEIEANPTFFIDKTADITILSSLELSQSRDDVLKTPELKTSVKINRPKSTSDKIKIAKDKKSKPIIVYAPSDSKKSRGKSRAIRTIGKLEKWFSDDSGSGEEESDDLILDYMENISPTEREQILKSFEIYDNYESPDENILQTHLNKVKRIDAKVERQDKQQKFGRKEKERKQQRERNESRMMRGPVRGPRGEKGSKKKGQYQGKFLKPQSWVQGQSLQDIVEQELQEYSQTMGTMGLRSDNNNNTTTIVDVDVTIDVDNVQTPTRKSRKAEKKEKKKGKKEGYDSKRLNAINENILILVDTDSLKELPMEPMNRTQRLQVLRLAACYNVKGISKGSGKRKYLILVKTAHTCYCDESTVKQTIKEVLSINSDPNVRAKGERFAPTKRAPLQKGRIVGEHAEPIDESNLGNRLLRSMGWSGGGLGALGQGIATPVIATIKQDKKGLGF